MVSSLSVVCSYFCLLFVLTWLFVPVPLVSLLLVVCSYPHSSRLSGRLQSESNQGREKKTSDDNDEDTMVIIIMIKTDDDQVMHIYRQRQHNM